MNGLISATTVIFGARATQLKLATFMRSRLANFAKPKVVAERSLAERPIE